MRIFLGSNIVGTMTFWQVLLSLLTSATTVQLLQWFEVNDTIFGSYGPIVGGVAALLLAIIASLSSGSESTQEAK